MVTGQEQDTVGGGFQPEQSFSGEFTELNIWNYLLNNETIYKLANCESYIEGDLLAWSKLSWQVYGEASWVGRSRDLLCTPSKRRVTFFPDRFSLPEAIHLCQTVGGNLTLPSSLAENTWLYEGTVSKAPYCSGGAGPAYMWLGAHDNHQEGQWVFLGSGIPIPWDGLWQGGRANGGPGKNCLVMLYGDFPSRWSDVSCLETNSLCASCEFSKRSTLNLRGPGVCDTSPFNRQYIIQGESGGKPALSGFFHSEIIYDDKAGAWIMRSLKIGGATARWAPITFGEYPFGTRQWTLGYDVCGLRKNDVVNMTLSVCTEGQFTCADGTCIDLAVRCDQREDCPDSSDEIGCSLVDIPSEYLTTMPPPPTKKNRPMPVKFYIDIVSFSFISIQEQTMGINFRLRLRWKDSRLLFRNLKLDRSLNVMSKESMHAVWRPEVLFRNAHGNMFTNMNEGAKIECIREGPSRPGGPDLPEEGL
ncbi:hypothetical protein SK128_028222 [Halocaridina rubra]|uniref:Uncharacterized protein n=1 Tax=Halocaridina rubra TaxID=373956 RepID=A0AAN9A925_HALRR